MEAILGPYMEGVAAFLKSWFVIFLLGALFGKIYADVGAAKVLGIKFSSLAIKFPGHEKIIGLWAVCLISFILIFGGVNSFVILFVMMPITKNIFEQLDIPWEFYGIQWLGSSVLATGTAPGSPSLQNIIPMKYLGTTPMAGAMMGLITSLVAIIGGHLYMLYVIRNRNKKGQGFLPSGAGIAASMVGDDNEEVPNLSLLVCLLPSVVLIVGLNVFKLSPELSMVIALALSLVLFRKQITDIKKSFVVGTSNAITAIVITAALAGIGKMVAATPGYALIISALNSVPGPAEIQVLIGIAVATGITSSGTSGLGLALESLGDHFISLGVAPGAIHRISSITSNTLNTLPHSSAVGTTVTHCKSSYKAMYGHIFILTVVLPMICALVGIACSMLGIV
jgi:H+/gluconate symporter-like permease